MLLSCHSWTPFVIKIIREIQLRNNDFFVLIYGFIIYMFSGESLPVTFRAKKYLLTDLFDWFGKEMQFIDETEEEVTVRVQVNEDAMRKWALQYALHVKVIKPERLVYMIQEDIKQAARQYRIVDLNQE